MNREQTKEAIKVMQAYVDGAEIEIEHPQESWIVIHDQPSWDWLHCDY